MKQHEFMARVRERGGYASQEETEQVTGAVLGVLAARIPRDEARDLAAQLPDSLSASVEADAGETAESYGVDEFCRRVADRLGSGTDAAERDAGAVLSTVADAVAGGELNQLISVLPSGYATLFGKPELGP